VTGTFDIVATAAFATAFCVAGLTAIKTRDRSLVRPVIYLAIASALMTFISASHAIEQFGLTRPGDPSEDYLQVLFMPLMIYMTYGLYTHCQKVRAERERHIMERLDRRLSASMQALDAERLEVLQALSAAVDARDQYTALHSMHVADYACAIAYKLGMRDEVPMFEQAGLLHDIGKIGVPDALLLKPAGLTDDEFEIIKTHTATSARIIGSVPFFSEVVPAVLHHHERWDGTGYPSGLAGDEIPMASRILAVADAFDAMTTDRPYRAAMNVADARARVIECRGTQFYPPAVDALLELLDAGIIMLESKASAA
jgi:putative nucleotidyltransferase with HDIG domain